MINRKILHNLDFIEDFFRPSFCTIFCHAQDLKVLVLIKIERKFSKMLVQVILGRVIQNPT